MASLFSSSSCDPKDFSYVASVVVDFSNDKDIGCESITISLSSKLPYRVSIK